jgi:hypothetical protein
MSFSVQNEINLMILGARPYFHLRGIIDDHYKLNMIKVFFQVIMPINTSIILLYIKTNPDQVVIKYPLH